MKSGGDDLISSSMSAVAGIYMAGYQAKDVLNRMLDRKMIQLETRLDQMIEKKINQHLKNK